MNLKLLGWVLGLATALVGLAAVAKVPQTGLPTKSLPPTVDVPFFADEGHGNPAGLITQADFSILDNKRPPQSIVAIRTAKELPLRLGILIDTSNSQRGSSLYQPEVLATSEFLKQVLNEPEDRVFIVSFNTVPNATDFMNKDELVNFKIDLRPGGATALFDAVYLACKERMNSDRMQLARRALVILSDGGDNLSHVNQEKAIAAAQETGTVIFAVNTNGNVNSNLGSMRLEQFANKTGGRAFLQLKHKDIPNVFSTLREQIEMMYVVTYVPSDSGQPGQYRSIEFKTTSSKKLKLRGPKGYIVTARVN